MESREVTKVVREKCSETLTYTMFPTVHWQRIHTKNAIERLNRRIRRHAQMVDTLQDGNRALMLLIA